MELTNDQVNLIVLSSIIGVIASKIFDLINWNKIFSENPIATIAGIFGMLLFWILLVQISTVYIWKLIKKSKPIEENKADFEGYIRNYESI